MSESAGYRDERVRRVPLRFRLSRLRWLPNRVMRAVARCRHCHGWGMEDASGWTDYGWEYNAYPCSWCGGVGHWRPFWRGDSEWWGEGRE